MVYLAKLCVLQKYFLFLWREYQPKLFGTNFLSFANLLPNKFAKRGRGPFGDNSPKTISSLDDHLASVSPGKHRDEGLRQLLKALDHCLPVAISSFNISHKNWEHCPKSWGPIGMIWNRLLFRNYSFLSRIRGHFLVHFDFKM